MITITHTHADGTLIDGSGKGDGVYEVLKGLRDNWRYFPSISRIGLGQSRDRNANTYKIERAATALRTAGHEVAVEVDESQRRSFAEAEAERYERADDRAERFGEYAGNAEARSDAAYARVRQIGDGIPFGQPILVGHHSERRHRRDIERMDAGMRKSIDEGRKAGHYSHRAEVAERYRGHRESIPTTLRRIEKLEADERRVKRSIAGRLDYVSDGAGGHKLATVKPQGDYLARLESSAADLADELAYWRDHVAKSQESGVKVWSAADFAKGDFACFLGTWYEVLRVNGKSVTIPAMISDGAVVTRANSRLSWTDTVAYHKINGRKSAGEMAELLAEVERREAAESAAS